MTSRACSFCLLLSLASVLIAACGTDKDDNGRDIHDIRLDSLDHERFYLNQYRGQVVMLVFWSTDCPQCIKELGALTPLARRIDAKRLTMATVCTDPENITDVRRIVGDLKLELPVLLDHNAAVKQRYGLRGRPATVLIAADGRVHAVQYGFSPALLKNLEQKLAVLLEAEIDA